MLGNSDPLEDVVLVVLIVLLKMILFFKEFFFFRKYGTNNSEKIKWVCTRIAPESIFFLFYKSKNMSKEDNSGRKTLISLLNSPVDSI